MLIIDDRVLLTFVRARGGKCEVLVEGPGDVYRSRALCQMLGPGQYEERLARIRGTTRHKSRACK
jgi:hypothetical protein